MSTVRFLRALLCAVLLPLAASAAPATASHPDPGLDPVTVVKLQLKALAHNDQPTADAGVATVFEFASPANRAQTGSLEHFSAILHAMYAPLLNHRSAQLRPIVMQGNRAVQVVDLVGRNGLPMRYVFLLSRQSRPPYAGCWMTDSVVAQPQRQEDQQEM